MAEAVAPPPLHRRLVRFFQDVRAEMTRVTWPDAGQIRQLSIAVIVLSLFVGAIIGVLDIALQLIFVEGIPAVFGR
jgi:preprotein translocase subunit SecE